MTTATPVNKANRKKKTPNITEQLYDLLPQIDTGWMGQPFENHSVRELITEVASEGIPVGELVNDSVNALTATVERWDRLTVKFTPGELTAEQLETGDTSEFVNAKALQDPVAYWRDAALLDATITVRQAVVDSVKGWLAALADIYASNHADWYMSLEGSELEPPVKGRIRRERRDGVRNLREQLWDHVGNNFDPGDWTKGRLFANYEFTPAQWAKVADPDGSARGFLPDDHCDRLDLLLAHAAHEVKAKPRLWVGSRADFDTKIRDLNEKAAGE